MTYSTLALERQQGIAIVTLTRTERANAISFQMQQDLDQVFTEAAADTQIRVVILTGQGKYFCAGHDLKDRFPDGWMDHLRGVFKKIEDLEKPVIAALNGYCLAGGCELALCCDFRLAGRSASVGLMEIRFGAVAIAGGTQRLPRLVGPSRAKLLHYTGDPVPAGEAYRIGLVDAVYPDESLLSEAKRLAQTLSERSPAALSLAKFLINRGMELDLTSALEFETRVARERPTDAAEQARARKKAMELFPVYRKIF